MPKSRHELPSQIRHFAERVLFSSHLDDKLRLPGTIVDTEPGHPVAVPDFPGRPKALDLTKHKPRANFPRAHQLNEEKQRSLVLHHFANHELLALELMALFLLRFPHAPSGLRKTLVHTMEDEQRHMGMYLQRIRDIGGDFGESPVNPFFWNSLSDMASPIEFLAGMSLTFEQANLDFSLYWRDAFQQAGDPQTSDILNEVYNDEIRHVRTGLNWFRKLKPPNLSDWAAYQQLLKFPLTASRAKGTTYCRVSRKAAGFDEHFIQMLSVFRHSKGRSPRVLWFNPFCDERAGNPSLKLNQTVLTLKTDLDHLPMFYCQPDDVILVHARPDAEFLEQLQNLQFPLPQFVVCDTVDTAKIPHRNIADWLPWGWSTKAVQAVSEIKKSLSAPAIHWDPKWQSAYSKLFANKLLTQWLAKHSEKHGIDPSVAGVPCQTLKEVEAQLDHGPMLVKAPFSTSGRHRRRLEKGGSENESRWIERSLKKYKTLLVEPHLKRVFDLSFHLPFGNEKPHHVRITRFFTDKNGKYRATLITRWEEGLPPSLLRKLHARDAKGHALPLLLSSMTGHIRNAPTFQEFPGPISIDALVYRASGQWELKPLVEINPRWTMSRAALQCRPRIHPGSSSLWILGSTREVQQHGFADLNDFRQHLEQLNPLKTKEGRIKSGVLWLTPPDRQHWICMWTHKNLSDGLRLWRQGLEEGKRASSLTQWCHPLPEVR